jgi:hypothetical protein
MKARPGGGNTEFKIGIPLGAALRTAPTLLHIGLSAPGLRPAAFTQLLCNYYV